MSSDSAPETGDALHRAAELHDVGRHAEARSTLLEALASGSGTSRAYGLLARIEHALNSPEREARALELALANSRAGMQPSELAGLWMRLGVARTRQGDPAGALAAFERASRMDPGLAPRQGMARARFALQDLAGIQRSVEELERRFPTAAFTHLFAGHANKVRGDPGAARDCYLRALELEPTLGEALFNLVDLGHDFLHEGIAARALEMLSRDDLAPVDRINTSFALARVLDGERRYAEAFERFRSANEIARDELVRQGIEYQASHIESFVARTISEYPLASFGSTDETSPGDLVPIFVIGLPRSGTTLVEQILVSHREVRSAGEITVAFECEEAFRRGRAAADRVGRIGTVDPLDARLLQDARERYLEGIFERGFDGGWVVDKLPANFEIAGFLRLMFPRSPIIHVQRDPRATCFSLYCANFAAHDPWYHDLDHLAHYYLQHRRLQRHWQEVLPGPYVSVSYDRLVCAPEAEIPALQRAVGLPIDPGCLEFHRKRRPIFTASHAQVRRPMYTGSLDHWRNYAEWLGPVGRLPAE